MFRNAYLTMVWEALVGSDNTYLKCSNGHLEQKGTSYKKTSTSLFLLYSGALTGPDHTCLRISNRHLEQEDTSCKNHQNTHVSQYFGSLEWVTACPLCHHNNTFEQPNRLYNPHVESTCFCIVWEIWQEYRTSKLSSVSYTHLTLPTKA